MSPSPYSTVIFQTIFDQKATYFAQLTIKLKTSAHTPQNAVWVDFHP